VKPGVSGSPTVRVWQSSLSCAGVCAKVEGFKADIAARLDLVTRCWAVSPSEYGIWSLHVAANGSVAGVHFVDGAPGAAEVHSCVEAVLRIVRFRDVLAAGDIQVAFSSDQR
jgi:hypothetical protein